MLLLTTLLLAPTALAIAFPGPAPTAAKANLLGFSPRPTGGPSLPELFRRQKDPALCGYLRGEAASPVNCSVGTCLYDDELSWFGCCTGTALSDCQLSTTCVGAASASSCLANSQCAGDDYVLACTASAAPACITMVRPVTEGVVSHLVCGASSRVVEVFATPTDGGSVVNTLQSSRSASGSGVVSTSRPAFSSGGGLPRSSQQASSSEELSSTQTTSSTRTSASSTTSSTALSVNVAATASTRASSTVSTAGAVKTAQAVMGAVGLAGVVAWVV